MEQTNDEWLRDIGAAEDVGAEAARAVVERLAKLDRAEYENERKSAARATQVARGRTRPGGREDPPARGCDGRG
jgi:hypothetical protein